MGKRYLCPICEHELKGLRVRCTHCRSRVKEPLVFTGAHLPNESDCYRADVDYMDPRNIDKQQKHFYEHKANMPDRPVFEFEEPDRRAGARRTLEQGREWLQEQQRRPASYGNKRSVTYGGSQRQTNRKAAQASNESVKTIIKIVAFVLILILGSC